MDRNKTLHFCSWNVRGLNNGDKCGNVLADLIPQHLSFLAI